MNLKEYDDLKYFQQKILRCFKCGDEDETQSAVEKLKRIEICIKEKNGDESLIFLEFLLKPIRQYINLKRVRDMENK